MLKYFLIAAVLMFFPIIAHAQTSDDQTRDLTDTAFLQSRPAGKKPIRKLPPRRYKIVGKKIAPPASMSAAKTSEIGVTIWRLRPAKESDDEEVRQFIYEQGEWTPERVASGESLGEGSRIQLTIESPRTGYLYVFNREIYNDKTFGEPVMIFPTLSISGGDNRVSAGKLMEIPSSQDKPPFYTLKRSSAKHEGETLTVIVTDKPLTDLTIGRISLKISVEQFDSYQKRWGAMTQQLELEGGAGTAMNKTERAAGQGKKVLTQNDSAPQTIYRVLAKPNQPLLLTIPLSIGAQSAESSEKSQP